MNAYAWNFVDLSAVPIFIVENLTTWTRGNTSGHLFCYEYHFYPSGPQFNMKMASYQYRKSHCGDKTILRPSYLHNGISYTGKKISLYWIRALKILQCNTCLLMTFSSHVAKWTCATFPCLNKCFYPCHWIFILGSMIIYLHFLLFPKTEMEHEVPSFHMKDKVPFILHTRYHGCWCPGYLCSHVMSCWRKLPEYCSLSTRLVNI